MDLFVQFVGFGEYAIIGRLDIEVEDGTTEGSEVRELIEVRQHHIEGLVTTPRESCHGAVLTVALRTEVGIDVRNQIVQQYRIERVTIGLHCLSLSERSLDVTALHHHDHRHSLTAGDSVIHDVLHISLLAPSCLILAHTMLQVEHRIAFLLELLQLILCRCIDHGMAPSLLLVAEVVDAAHLTVRNTLLRTVVVTFAALGNLNTTCLAVTAEERLRSRIDEVHATDIHEIVVEALYQRIGDSHPATLTVVLHIILLVTDVEHHLLGIRSVQVEIATTLRIELGELVTRNSCRSDERISRYLDLLGCLHLRTYGLITQETSHSLTITAT